MNYFVFIPPDMAAVCLKKLGGTTKNCKTPLQACTSCALTMIPMCREELVLQLKQENAVLSAEIEHSQEQLRLSSLQHEEENLQLQEQMQAQLSAMQKYFT